MAGSGRLAPAIGALVLWALLETSDCNEILEADSEDPLLIVDHQQTAEETRLPNSHSAALVMAFIFLCVFAYGAYRFCRCKCGKKQPLTVNLGGSKDGTSGDLDGLKDYIKEREAYLAIYGPRKSISNSSESVPQKEQPAADGRHCRY